MNLFQSFQRHIIELVDTLSSDGRLPPGLDATRVTVEPPRDASHGDVTTNAAMVLAKAAAMKPRDLAAILKGGLEDLDAVTSAEIAGPGFINLKLAPAFWLDRLREILRAGTAYGDSDMGAGKPVNVEYVSANPTGPMHVGHGRGAVIGDALANLLQKAGFQVTREYYINDAGSQVDSLARALYLRYRMVCGDATQADFDKALAEGAIEYGGDYLVHPAEALKLRDGDQWIGAEEAVWLPALRDFAVERMMDLIREDLALAGITFDVFTSERALVDAGAVDEAIRDLDDRGLIYVGVLEPPKGKPVDDWEARPQTLFRASDFGDDVDRPIKKGDGSWTYFATDMAYHRDKVRRGFADMIDVWGADHGGYVKRMTAAVKALTEGEGALDVKLCNMVKLLDGGQPVKMSKRAGTFVTLREVIEQVGKDVVRFIMLTRKNDQGLEFDLKKVTEQSRENPVFYVQYAHARVCSVLRNAAEAYGASALEPEALATLDLSRLTDPSEMALIRLLADWPRQVEAAADSHEPHRIAYYLGDVAAGFHSLWNKGKDDAGLKFLIEGEAELSMARMALIQGVALVIASGLAVMGVAPLEEMR